MRKVTTTKQIHNALSKNLLQVIRVEVYNKTSRKIEVIDINSFKENLDFLSESGIFSDCIGWYYEDNCNADSDYIIECSRRDASVDVIVTVYLNVGDDVDVDDIEKVLLPVEEE